MKDQIDRFNRIIDTEGDTLVKSEGRAIEHTQTDIQRERKWIGKQRRV